MTRRSGFRRRVPALFLAACLAATPVAAFKRTAKGSVVADFSLLGMNGVPVQLTEQWGDKATILIFWASWSPRSTEALDDLQQLYEQHRGAGLRVVAINVEHQELSAEERAALVALVAASGWNFPVLMDERLTVFDQYGVVAVPSLILADGRGMVLELLDGYSNMTRGAFRERALEALGLLQPAVARAAGEADTYVPAGTAARYYQMGELFLRKKMPGRAVKAYRQALGEDPAYAAAYLRLAEALDLDGETIAAVEARQQAARLGAAPPVSAAAAPPAPSHGAAKPKEGKP